MHEVLQESGQKDPQLEGRGNHPNAAFDKDVRATSTPAAVASVADQDLQSASAERVEHQGSDRHHATLPHRRRAAARADTRRHRHRSKTGTIGGTVNDVGVMTLPDGKRQIVIAVFIERGATNRWQCA